ncbi:MAG: SMP-30/gluconolactonase/LRE family protein [Bryobacteraceae bacterium]
MRLAMVAASLLACSLAAQDFSNLSVEKIAANYKFTEGPAWSKEGFLLFSDVPTDRILKATSEGVTPFRVKSNGANGNAYDDKGRLYTCESRTRRVVRTDRKGVVETLADTFEGKRFNAPNDIVVSKSGNVYFTDPAFGSQADTRELAHYGVYRISAKGDISLIAKPEGRPNGIALSPDGKILYVANSDERNVRAYDVGRDGAVSGERTFVSAIEGVPDGMRTDPKGNLYVAAKHLFVFTPDGKQLAAIQIPETPTNCSFGEADGGTLFVTAQTSVYRIRLHQTGAAN